MDYSQTTQSGKSEAEQSFFTTGAGDNFETEAPFGAENNLDLSNPSAGWSEPSNTRANHRELGNRSIVSSANTSGETPNLAASPALGEIVDPLMPPGTSGEAFVSNPQSTPVPPQRPGKEKTSVKEVDDLLTKFNQGGIDVSKLYATISEERGKLHDQEEAE